MKHNLETTVQLVRKVPDLLEITVKTIWPDSSDKVASLSTQLAQKSIVIAVPHWEYFHLILISLVPHTQQPHLRIMVSNTPQHPISKVNQLLTWKYLT